MTFLRGYGAGFALISACLCFCFDQALAERIGGSNLPASAPTLKGRIDDGGGPSTAFAIGTAVGATTNAGPTFVEQASAFTEHSLAFAHTRATAAGRLDVSVSLSNKIYAVFEEANEITGAAGLSLTKDWAGQQTILALAATRGLDVEERVSDIGLSFGHAWTDGLAKPFVKAETAFVNYDDISDPLQPIRNQDDRDRISSRVEAGLRMTITEHVELTVGAGLDHKHYVAGLDDFGIGRDSRTPFGALGLSWSWQTAKLSAVYMPFYRHFREDLFAAEWRHGYVVEGEVQISDALKAFAAARYGFEETDFLIASSAYERVVLGGLVVSLDGGATVSIAASQTWRGYGDLGLVEVARDDRKFEIAAAGEVPLTPDLSLTARVNYLSYATSLGDVGTDALTASLGLTYAAAR